jgi:hypothetical protein
MSEIRIWVDATGSSRNESTEFLLQDPENTIPLADQTISNEQLPQQGWYTLDFDPDWQSIGKAYILTIRTEAAQGSLGPRFADNPVPVNMGGKLRINNQDTDRNLVYQYGCIAGLKKVWWTIRYR